MNYPKSIEKVIENFRCLPGVGERTAERYMYRILDLDDEIVCKIAQDLMDLKTNIHHCPKCGHFTDEELCEVCADSSRDSKVICVVQSPKDIYSLEKTGYTGMYHVLHGAISPQKGILPEDSNIDSLVNRVKEEGVQEVILATNPTLDGETTAMYITKLLKEYPVTVTRLASGLPMGASLDYADELTLLKAMQGRIKQ